MKMKKNWLEFVLSSDKEKHLVQLKNQKCKKYLKMDFFLLLINILRVQTKVYLFLLMQKKRN